MSLPGGPEGKAPGDPGLIPRSGRSPGDGHGNPPQYSCLENPMDRGAWEATVQGAAESRTRLSDFTFLPFLSFPSPCGPPRVGMNGIHAPAFPSKLPLVSCWDFSMTAPNQKPQDQAACPGWSPGTERRWSRGDQTNSGPGGPRADAHKGKQGGRSNDSS